MKLDIKSRLIKWLGGDTPEDDRLRYSKPKNGRCNVYYGNNYLCTCEERQKDAVQAFFDAHYDGDIEAISASMKRQFNLRVQQATPKVKRGRKLTPYFENKLRFADTPTKDRIRVQITDMGNTEQLCTCYRHQKPEVILRYGALKNSHSLEEIKSIMKREYNLR